MEMNALFPVAVGVHREKVAVALYEAEVMEGLSFHK